MSRTQSLPKNQHFNLPTSPSLKFLKQLHAISTTKSTPNLSIWCYIIKSYLTLGQPLHSLLTFSQSRSQGRHISSLLPLVLKASASLSLILPGKTLHSHSIKTGFAVDFTIGTSLISMYSKCGVIEDARKVFDEMPVRNVVAWNAMIGGCFKNGDTVSALGLFERMPGRNAVSWAEMIDGLARSGDTAAARRMFDRAPPKMRNLVTWTVMVDGYVSNGEMDAARRVFEEMSQRNFYVWSSMVSGYFKEGNVDEARKMFDRIPARNLVNWNALIAGYAQNGLCEESLSAFERMRAEGFEPDEVSVASALSACAQLGLLDTGRRIHEMINRKRIKLNQFVVNALVDMYAKCGDVSRARQIFEGMQERNDVCWNAMISGLAIHGQCEDALDLFRQMELSEQKPNESTFLAVFSACAHGGFVEDGLENFAKMKEKYGLVAGIQHYGCLVDLLGRAGRLNDAYCLIKTMPMKPNDVVWGALLGACRIHMDMKMSEQVVEEAGMREVKFDSSDDAPYVLLSNIYAAADQWEQAECMRMILVKNKLQKTAGCSSIMVGNTEHQFHAVAQAEPQINLLVGVS